VTQVERESASEEPGPEPEQKIHRRVREPGGRPVSFLPVFSVKEGADLKARAAAEGYTPTTWIAETVVALLYGRAGLSIGERRLISASVDPLVRQLRRIGTNLNQLMKAVNSGEVAETPMVEATLDRLNRDLAGVEAFLDRVDPGWRER
jgi:Bacterial mobilisation protein (MobC)